jgi:Cu2+-exporting ATPase
MKTSVIEVHDMLSVLSVEEVERRIGEVPGVESVTVNFAAGSATARYDETRLEISDIKSAVRQRGYESSSSPVALADEPHEGTSAHSAPHGASAPALPSINTDKPAEVGAPLIGISQQETAATPPTPESSSAIPAAVPAAIADDGPKDKTEPDKM